MTNKEYEIALAIARQNRDMIVKKIPTDIKERENALFNKISKSGSGPLKQLELLFSEMDVLSGFFHKYTACKKGCNYCCHIKIDVSDLEVKYIKKWAKVNTLSDEVKTVADGMPCPFLKNNICSIYKYRPFLCRRHVSVANSSRWCELDVCNDNKFPLVHFSEVNKCYDYIHQGITPDRLEDIRKVFARV